MLELVGGIISIVVGVIMLIIGGSIINTVTTNGAIGECTAQDYNGDGVVGYNDYQGFGNLTASANNTDSLTLAYSQCVSTNNNGYTILNIISVMMIIGGVVMSVRGFAGS